jgi:hypothetical protein
MSATTLTRRVERLETEQGGPCPACHDRLRLHVQRGPDGPPPVPCVACGAPPLVIVLRRVPARTAADRE